VIEQLADQESEVRDNLDLLKKLSSLKYKDILRESLNEYQRKGNFLRIYPAKGTDCYDTFF
jgi:hypothetical protein